MPPGQQLGAVLSRWPHVISRISMGLGSAIRGRDESTHGFGTTSFTLKMVRGLYKTT